MIISRFGVRLIRLGKEHIELVRYWRNSDRIRNVMEYRAIISPEMQLQWFLSLHAANDFYFIIEHEAKLIGMIHISKTDWEDKNAQSGLFIWDENFIGSPVPVVASLNLLHLVFDIFQLEQIEAKVKNDNFAALSYNKLLGFQEPEDAPKSDFVNIFLTKNSFKKSESQILKHLDNYENEKFILQLFPEDVFVKELIDRHEALPKNFEVTS